MSLMSSRSAEVSDTFSANMSKTATLSPFYPLGGSMTGESGIEKINKDEGKKIRRRVPGWDTDRI